MKTLTKCLSISWCYEMHFQDWDWLFLATETYHMNVAGWVLNVQNPENFTVKQNQKLWRHFLFEAAGWREPCATPVARLGHTPLPAPRRSAPPSPPLPPLPPAHLPAAEESVVTGCNRPEWSSDGIPACKLRPLNLKKKNSPDLLTVIETKIGR
jgi:hypothetical protein